MYRKFSILLILSFSILFGKMFAQGRADLLPEDIIDKFIEKVGGEKWRDLKSRKEYAYVEYEEDKKSIIPGKSYDRMKIDLIEGVSMDMHKMFGQLRSLLVLKPQCNWYYSPRSQTIKFFGPEPVKFRKQFPRTELMEVLNLEARKKVVIEDTLYRVDYADARQLNGKQSLFFGVNSGLLFKRSFTSKSEVHWEFHFSNYSESQGFVEPNIIKLVSNGKDFFTITVKTILYNLEIDPTIFSPPVPCKDQDDFGRLEFPYAPNIE